MANRENFLNKIDVQEKEWGSQMRLLQEQVSRLDKEKRVKFEQYVFQLKLKLMVIEKQSEDLKLASGNVWEKYGDKISDCWDELVHNVDFVIANYKKIFEQ